MPIRCTIRRDWEVNDIDVKAALVAADGPRDLLERSGSLASLQGHLAAVIGRSQGRLVLLRGEAGVGKTALVRAFCDQHSDAARILTGACDALFTPRPLGAFIDIAQNTAGELDHLIGGAAKPYEVAATLIRDLRAWPPTLLVLEDLHWADEATVDVLRLLGRRIESLPALILATYRDDELDAAHPLRFLLGELPSGGAVSRIHLAPLSLTAVAQLAERHAVDADELYRKTSGNPFFVTEVLAAGEVGIPDTVREAVLARAARLSPAARTLLETVAVAPPQAELQLVEALVPGAVEQLDECLTSGMLASQPGAVGFRHELARLAVEDSLPAHRRVALHRRVLAALSTPGSGTPDRARLAHHAEAAGDAAAVLLHAQAAAEDAARLGAHREAAGQYARALRFAADLPTAALAELLERRAFACYLTSQFSEAIEAQTGALECHRRLGNSLGEGDSLRALSRLLRFVGRTEEAAAVGQQAVDVLEALPPGHELAMAYCNVSHLCMNIEDTDGAVTWGRRALELAETLDDVEGRVYALINLGTADYITGRPQGVEMLEQALHIAQVAGLEEHAGRAYVAFTWWAPRTRSYAVGDAHLEAGLEYCTERGLDLWRLYLLAYQARTRLDRGNWDGAVEAAAVVLRDPRTSPVPRIVSLAVLGLVRARRGDPDFSPPLQEAWELARPTAELQRIEPVAAARAEVAWLLGSRDGVAEATDLALDIAVRRRASVVVGELACWRRRAGIDEPLPASAAEPYTLELAGHWEQAAEFWTRGGCSYEAAVVLAGAGVDDALQRSLAEFQRLGARVAASLVVRRLRERGVRGTPRGPRPSTQQNPANLTVRELEVLQLVSAGMRNGDIAERLFLSEKTVGHHVSAILAKLDVRSRGEARSRAAGLGLTIREP